jgi:hypothetical protein
MAVSGMPAGNGALRLAPGTTLADMRLVSSDDGQYLFIYCGQIIVAMMGSMGGDVDFFEFADASRISALDLIEKLSPAQIGE